MSTQERIWPIIRRTYGGNAMSQALAENLAAHIDKWSPSAAGSREDMIMRICWDWMTGGSTAKAVAKRIEEALKVQA